MTIIISIIIIIIIIIIRDDLLATISSNKRENDQKSLRNRGRMKLDRRVEKIFHGVGNIFRIMVADAGWVEPDKDPTPPPLRKKRYRIHLWPSDFKSISEI